MGHRDCMPQAVLRRRPPLGYQPADALTLEISPTIDFAEGEPRRVAVEESGGARRYLLELEHRPA